MASCLFPRGIMSLSNFLQIIIKKMNSSTEESVTKTNVDGLGLDVVGKSILT